METHDHMPTGAPAPGVPFEIDPVCGMKVDPAHAAGHADHQGRTYYFCAPRCRERFVADPARYLKPQAPALIQLGGLKKSAAAPPPSPPVTAADAGVEYTCPMHPEVRQIGPGSCPLCGMALEPVEMTAEEPENEELVDMTRRFRVSVVLTIPVF